jgi:hypothetical protein
MKKKKPPPPPIVLTEKSGVAWEAFERALDEIQQKHHPGSMPFGHERVFGEHFPEDDHDDEP